MESEIIELKAGEQKNITLPNRGARGLMLTHHVEDDLIVDVTRKEIKSMEELTALHVSPGDPIPAVFMIKAKQPGKTKLIFTEKKVGMPESTDIGLKEFTIVVK